MIKKNNKKWQSDKKYQAKIKLLLYGIFIIIVTIYVMIINNQQLNNNIIENTVNNQNEEITENIIIVPNNYNYQIDITIDDTNINYIGTKIANKKTFTKIINNISTNYIEENNEYYIEDNDIFINITKDEVYDIVNYNYINIDNINNYLSKSVKNNNQYLVYLKDVVLGNKSNDYFIIQVNNNEISVDYTPLVKEYNNNIEKYKVRIKIEEYKEVN